MAVDDLVGLPTPNLDALAAQGMRFTVAISHPVCDRTRRSLLFGQRVPGSSAAGCDDDASHAPPLKLTSLAELAPDVSAALVGKWHLGGDPAGGPWECAPESHGFRWLAGSSGNVLSCGGANYSYWRRAQDCVSAIHAEYEPQAVADSLRVWWQTAPGRRLAVMAANLAHAPFHEPPPELTRAVPPAFTARQKYEAMIVAYDTLIGQVLSVVDLRSTLVVVVADNGTPPLVAPPELNGKAKGTCFERGIRVPLIVAGAGILTGESDALVGAVDVYATIADYLGSPSRGDGISLRPALEGQPFKGSQYIFSATSRDSCARSARYKLRRLADGTESFFDLALDPTETTDRILDPSLTSEIDDHRVWLDASEP